jgi:hypothetical protein
MLRIRSVLQPAVCNWARTCLREFMIVREVLNLKWPDECVLDLVCVVAGSPRTAKRKVEYRAVAGE